MEDRYLFRAKRADNGEWVAGHLITDEQDDSKCFIADVFGTDEDGHPHDTDAVLVDNSTICQCTGLKDKNGKLIWDNDIVKHDFGEYQIGVQLAIVKYDSKYACYQIKPIYDWMYCDKSDCEVIGNIFDNKELLESEEK